MNKEYISIIDFGEDANAGIDAVQSEVADFAAAHVGKTSARSEVTSRVGRQWKPEVHRRTKAFQTIMQVQNVLKTNTDKGLFFCHITPKVETGCCPFAWPSLSLSTDCGPDMVAMYFYLTYGCTYNIDFTWDPSHDKNNCSIGILKHSGIWPIIVAFAGAHNAVYGSKLSPSRFPFIKEAVREYFNHIDLGSEQWFQTQLPDLIKSLHLDVNPGDADCCEAFQSLCCIVVITICC